MGLTNGHAAFASLSAAGINKFLNNLAAARPHYFNYGTGGFGGSPTSPTRDLVPELMGIGYKVDISTPQIDFSPGSAAFATAVQLPQSLTLGATQQFAVFVDAHICVVADGEEKGNPICADLKVWAIGEPEPQQSAVQFRLGAKDDAIVVENIGDVEKIAEVFAKKALNIVLAKAAYPAEKQAFGLFSFSLTDGPTIEDEQIKVWGDLS